MEIMKKYMKFIPVIAAVIVVIVILVFQNKNRDHSDPMQAVYLEKENGNNIFVNLEAGYPFYGTIPEDALYDENGEKIETEDLNNGDVVDIYGNGAIAESYPAQYHGVTKIIRKEQASQDYIEQYGYLLDELFVEKDPAERPHLNVCYTDELAAVSVMIPEALGYTWTYEENGERKTITEDAPDILQASPVEVKKLSEPMQMELQFDEMPDQIRIYSWDDGLLGVEQGAAGQIPEGTAVEVGINDNGSPEFTAQPGCVYMARGEWENGTVEYAFWTPAEQG